ncbi:MAG: haloalkane dehalogenase [Acidobacteriota bacterium]|nr:haloalkane dehalogenase [Acidobacteriota bacterium]
MKLLRTPEDRFASLPDYPFEPHYTDIGGIRIHHVEAGPADGAVVLMLHGEPTWSYLYRHMLPVLAEAGLRAIAPDLVGFGRSDKPAEVRDYSYAAHVEWVSEWIRANALENITLVCQDWGSLIGLRIVAEQPERFARVVAANAFLPTGDQGAPLAFRTWQAFARFTPILPIGAIVRAGTVRKLPRDIVRAYKAPFPDETYKAGARAFPVLVPTRSDDPATPANRRAWAALRDFDRPFLTVFGERDPIFRGLDRVLQRHVRGAAGQPHQTLRGAGHFIQEDRGVELARITAQFVASA